jgi:hypothetical protein
MIADFQAYRQADRQKGKQALLETDRRQADMCSANRHTAGRLYDSRPARASRQIVSSHIESGQTIGRELYGRKADWHQIDR